MNESGVLERAAQRWVARRDIVLAGASAAAWLALPVSVLAQESDAPTLETLAVGAARIELQFAPGLDARLQAEARAWVLRSAAAVAGYFGRFPVPRVEIVVTPVGGAGVRGGTTYAEPSLLIRTRLGRETTRSQLLNDWVMVHEMVHLAIPSVPRSQSWLHEGIATYVEGVARGRAGLIEPAAVWREWMAGMPRGQPEPGDAGLDHTPTWGRTYWGGAMFCLLGDVALLTRSSRQAGLRQALQGVLAAGGSYAVPWPAGRIVATADQAVGQTALAELYERMKGSPAPTDLDRLWRELGVAGNGFDDDAPLAAVRRAILS